MNLKGSNFSFLWVLCACTLALGPAACGQAGGGGSDGGGGEPDDGPDADAEAEIETETQAEVSSAETDMAEVTDDGPEVPACEDQCVIGVEACQGSIHTKCQFDLVVGCAVPVWIEDCGAQGQQCFDAGCVDACVDLCDEGTVGCQGTVAWFCTETGPCMKKKAVADCSLVGQLCKDGQCVEEDGNPGTTLGILCPDIHDCLIANCPNTGDAFCMEVAFIDICSPLAENDTEIQNFMNWNGCIQNNCQGATSQGQLYGCLRTSCLHETAECYSGGVYGPGYCDTFNTCVIACPGGTSMVAYHKCLRACTSQVSKQAVEVFFNANYCMNEACLDQGMAQACVEDAQYGACYGDIGACYP
jgi:hypothetical protein